MGIYGLVMYSEYSPQPSTFVELNAYRALACETPSSIILSNCISWPGRTSWAMIVQEAASNVKSSYLSAFSPAAGGIFRGRTKTPRWPVLFKNGGGTICGAGC